MTSNAALSYPRAQPHPAVVGGLAEDQFKAVFRNHPAGVAIVTAEGPEGPVALTATSVTSLSAAPPTLLFSVSSRSTTAPALIDADTVVVHLLDESHAELAALCSTSGADRFAAPVAWTRLVTGEPLYSGVATWVRGAIVHRMDVGGSTVLVVRALEAAHATAPKASRPLVYHNRAWHALGPESRLPDL